MVNTMTLAKSVLDSFQKIPNTELEKAYKLLMAAKSNIYVAEHTEMSEWSVKKLRKLVGIVGQKGRKNKSKKSKVKAIPKTQTTLETSDFVESVKESTDKTKILITYAYLTGQTGNRNIKDRLKSIISWCEKQMEVV